MLDTATKKRIDDCRDILVGKLPDPKAQIEQITIGLIYKFMDDMDKEAIELGGTAKFFSGNFVKYSWDALFDTKVTANEMLGLYSEAIVSMDKNPNIPQLFRDIFKNAYLPYRDPETLKLFLKTIGEFEYTHSEKLGDAFEYLLSVMGSQGDAGQFRTPRHIIDFLVAVVDPGKTDTILDPACGTAGFLISAFKYIMNGGNGGGDAVETRHALSLPPDTPSTPNTPDERKKLIQNFVGYDISPDMVRLSLVNLYLHGFSDPHISEYDTLSSEERWDENFDVILANPPFMSPKGGIRPHKRFTVSSNRSEVLFVDYIAEHLNPKGRAGVIVPEGVIFQSGTAYKELRKMLVENYLYAVVSLPAGIFNPYSGVKTSILLMDKEIAKRSNEILFVKIDNDGYNLGAQRNAVKGGQLEAAITVIRSFTQSFWDENGAHDATGDAATADAATNNNTAAPNANNNTADINTVDAGDAVNAGDTVDSTDVDGTAIGGGAVYGGARVDCGAVDGGARVDCGAVDGGARVDCGAVETRHALSLPHTPPHTQSIAHAVPKSEIAKNGDYNLSGERYKTQIISSTVYPLIPIEELFDSIRNGRNVNQIDEIGKYRVTRIQTIADKTVDLEKTKWTNDDIPEDYFMEEGDILLSHINSFEHLAKSAIFKGISEKVVHGTNLIRFKPNKNKVVPEYVASIFKSDFFIEKAKTFAQKAVNQASLRVADLKSIQIPLPPLSIQQEIVSEIEGYQKIIDGAKMVVENYKPKITIDPEWEIVELYEICEVKSGGTPDRGNDSYWNGTIPYIKTGQIYFNHIFEADEFITEEGLNNSSTRLIPIGTILMAMYGQGITRGRVAILEIEAAINQAVAAISLKDKRIEIPFLYFQLQGLYEYLREISDARGGNQSNLNSKLIKELKIAFPPIKTQRQIVAQIEKEQELVNASKQLVEIFEQKIKDRIAKVWGA